MKSLEDMEFCDDLIFNFAMNEERFCKKVIEISLGTKLSKITYKETQKERKQFLTTKGVRFDAYVEADGTVFEVEMQTSHYSSILRRSRFYQGQLDGSSLKSPEYYDALKDTVILFICKTDPFGAALPVYTVERKCKEDATVNVDNGTKEVYLNASAYEKLEPGELKSFLQYIATKKVTDDFTKELDDFVEETKKDTEVINMYSRMDLMLYDERKYAREEGREEGREEERAKSQKELDEKQKEIDKKQIRIAELEARLKMYEKSA